MPCPLIGFYGDDFTGSTDAMESLTLAGLDTILITDAEHAGEIGDLMSFDAVGLAGMSRSMSPARMKEHLPAAFSLLKSLGVRICHYKVCSTFDSSPAYGSIGCALDIGRQVFGHGVVPVIAGAPALGRYQVFGNLFAQTAGSIYRLDRHPNMMRHPVTPMTEADLRVHLAAQTAAPMDLMTLVEMQASDADETFRGKVAKDWGALFLDVFDDRTCTVAGRLIWTCLDHPAFVVGSSGVEHGLANHWLESGLIDAPAPIPPAPVADQVIVLSGSCSPVTEAQILWAQRAGYASFRLRGSNLLGATDARDDYLEQLSGETVAALGEGRNVLVYSAIGPQDPEIGALTRSAAAHGLPVEEAQGRVGDALSGVLTRVLPQTACRRVVIAGGDTSGRLVSALGLTSLRMIAPLVRGAPLCRATAQESWADGLEVVLKGGQMGPPNFFEMVRLGEADDTPRGS